MSVTGIATLDHAPQVVAEWLNRLEEHLAWQDRSRSYLLLRVTLHAVRDFLTVDEAVDLSAQLPVLLRGLYFEGWVPSHTPAQHRSKSDFIARVTAHFSDRPLEDPEAAVAAVFDLLRRQVSEGEFNQVANAMRKSLRDLWL
jgi:uncharacterized protein (DUF2267 family)